jgi:hypothetical protein
MAGMPAFLDAFDNDRVVAGHVRHLFYTRSGSCGLFAA